jgi:hypothetical protein
LDLQIFQSKLPVEASFHVDSLADPFQWDLKDGIGLRKTTPREESEAIKPLISNGQQRRKSFPIKTQADKRGKSFANFVIHTPIDGP